MASHIRIAGPQDVPAMASVYADAVRAIGPQAYAPEQVAVWARFAEEPEFADRLARGFVLVAEVDETVAAFGQLEPLTHVAFLYCRSTCSRRGLGTAIYQRLEARATAAGAGQLTTDASRISRPFFAQQGFRVVHVEHPVRHGLTFERFRMEKVLPGVREVRR